ncbi:MAG TPA: twin-arginine translocase subunit TatC [Anaerolineales bacterium]|nr:twin-arginine translocase subunit TatC [Anaerolineales bacterium]
MRKFFRAFWRVVTFPFRALWWLITLPVRAVRKISRFLTSEPEEQPITDVLVDTVQRPANLIEHIDALRRHLTRMLIGLVICIAVLFFFTQDIINILALPIGGLKVLKAISPTETIGAWMNVAIFGAIALCSPYIAFELWLFAAPGLKPKERIISLLSIPLVLIFFLSGIAFAYFMLLPPALKFLFHFMNVEVIPTIKTYISFVTGILFWIGAVFEFPLVIFVLTLIGIVKPQPLLKQWRIAVVIIAIIAAAITPTTDPINMSLVMGPMIGLYFISIGLSYLAALSRKKRAMQEQESD